MEHIIKVDIEEVAYFKSIKERQKLVENLLCNMSDLDYKQTIKNELKDILDAEEEFDRRDEIINALKILIEKY